MWQFRKVKKSNADLGFSLIEMMFALVIIMVAMLAIFSVFTYAVTYSAGNNSRAQALAVMQEEVELLRSKKFTPGFTDPDLTGGVKVSKLRAVPNNGTFLINTDVDNEPGVDGIQDETYQCLSPQGVIIPCTIKEIRVTVRLNSPSPGWQTAIPASIVVRRVRAN